MEMKEIAELIKVVSEHGLTRLKVEQGDFKLVIQKDGVLDGTGLERTGAERTGTERISSEIIRSDVTKSEPEDEGYLMTCPLVGTFYSAASPEAENFVKVGDRVKKGQILGIVEAMKLMNEIESEYDGVIEEILAENESVVEYGQPLFRISKR